MKALTQDQLARWADEILAVKNEDMFTEYDWDQDVDVDSLTGEDL